MANSRALVSFRLRAVLSALTIVVLLTPGAHAFVVNSSTSTSDTNPGNGECWTGAMIGGAKECSLYAAILEINATPGGGTITFGVPSVTTNYLPTVTKPIVIDGASQGRAEVRGVLGGYEPTLVLKGGSSTLRHVVFGDGVRFETGGGNLVEDCYIGTDPTGTVARHGAGLQIKDAANNVVRGNVISDNNGLTAGVLISGATATNNAVVGNFIGTDPTGTLNLSNGINAAGVQLANAPGNTIGGPNAEDRNVISGTGTGVVVYGATATGNTIHGNLIGTDVTGTKALEELGGSGVYITGASENVVQDNVVSGNNNGGIQIEDGDGNQILGNLIGTDAAGTHAVTFAGPPEHAQLVGVRIIDGANNVVGKPGAGNTIAGNESGVVIQGSTSTGNRVQANDIGTSSGGDEIGNDNSGVFIFLGTDNLVGGLDAGAGNRIAYNGSDGVGVLGAASVGNAIVGNRIFSNADLAIDLGADGVTANDATDADSGANGLQNYPDLTMVKGVLQGSLTTNPGTYRLEFFSLDACDASGHGEAQTLVASTTVTTNGGGVATFTPPAPPRGRFLAATATAMVNDAPGDTSELSLCAQEAGTAPAKDGFVVDSVGDEPDLSPGNGVCAAANGTCTLRAAIQESNVLPKRQTITFDLAGGGPFTIQPSTPLPIVDRALAIDGTTQPGAGTTLAIELDGSAAGPTADGLVFSDGKSALKGLVVNRFGRHGVVLRDKDKNVVQGNYIGTDVTGTLARPNGGDGIYVYASAKNVIGGPAVNLGNLVSGNTGHGIYCDTGADKNVVVGNTVGTNLDRTAALGNGGSGIVLALRTSKCIVGAGGPSANLVSGNGGAGIAISDKAGGHKILGNRIGTNDAGTAKIPNVVGIVLDGALRNTIGDEAEGNLVSGNLEGGIRLLGGANENDVVANLVGTTADGLQPLGNGGPGIGIDGSAENVLEANVIGANDFGVAVNGAAAIENVVRANWIGTDPEVTVDLGNKGFGIAILNDARDNVIGGKNAKFGNVIAGNGGLASGGGIGILSGVRNAIRANAIFANEPVNVDLGTDGVTPADPGDADVGPNTLQNAPELLDAARTDGKLRVHGRLASTPKGKFTVDYFLADVCPSGTGEASRYWKSQKVKTGDDGNAEFTLEVKEKGLPFGAFFAATATDAVGNTSELSFCVPIAGAP